MSALRGKKIRTLKGGHDSREAPCVIGYALKVLNLIAYLFFAAPKTTSN